MSVEEQHWSNENVEVYYDNIVKVFESGDNDLLIAHFGLVGEDGLSFPHLEPLHNSLRVLVQGLDLKPGMRILDAGCGLGGDAFTLAQETGVSVVGLTIAPSHIPNLEKTAKKRNLDHLCEFHLGDFNDPPFPDCHFDAVIQHESFCHVHDREPFLRGIRRILKPGGRWQMLDYAATADHLSEEHQELVDRTCKLGRIPPMVPVWDMLRFLKNAGFVDCIVIDQNASFVPYARDIAAALKEWLFHFHFSGRYTPEHVQTIDGIIFFEKGVAKGAIEYVFLSGRRPYEN